MEGGCRCQQAVAKSAQKLDETMLGEFLRRKKSALKSGAGSSAELQSCFDDEATEGSVAADTKSRLGRALGYWMGQWQDVHGAGAQRSDPKTGNPDDYPSGHGPQGDAVRIYNYVRCVRDQG